MRMFDPSDCYVLYVCVPFAVQNVRGGDLFDSHHAGAPMAAIREEDDLIDYDEA